MLSIIPYTMLRSITILVLIIIYTSFFIHVTTAKQNNFSKKSVNASWKPRSYLESPSSSSSFQQQQHQEVAPIQRWQNPRGGGDDDDKYEIKDLSLPRVDVSSSEEDKNESYILSNNNNNNNQEGDQKEKIHPPHQVSTTTTTSSNQGDFFQRHPFHSRHLNRNEEKAILGRAVLTTPHRRMPAIRIAPGPRPPFLTPQNSGPIFSSTPIHVTKSTICKSLNCALRDLRIIDQVSYNNGGTVTSKYAGPAFLARRNCVIVNVGHVRAIVMRDQVIIFIPSWEQQQESNSVNGSSSGGVSIQHHGNNNNGANSDIMETINNLVEALVTHLNSIYHPHHHYLIVDNGYTKMPTNSTSPYIMSNGESAASYFTESMDQQSGLELNAEPLSVEEGQKRITNDQHQKRFFRQKDNSKHHQPQQKLDHINQTSAQTTIKTPPFELVVIEALLGHVCSHESNKATNLIQTANDVLSGITYTGNSSNKKKDAFLETQRKLGELLPLKNMVDGLEAECSDVANAIADVLKNDEDMAAMRLSEIAALRDMHDNIESSDDLFEDGDPLNLHVEVELLFEDYLLQMDEVLHSLRSIQSSITNTEEVVEIELDLLRNRIMRYEMLLELSGLVVGIAAAVTGAFGMNLVNHFEDHPRMFYEVSAVLLVCMGLMGYAILRKLAVDNIL